MATSPDSQRQSDYFLGTCDLGPVLKVPSRSDVSEEWIACDSTHEIPPFEVQVEKSRQLLALLGELQSQGVLTLRYRLARHDSDPESSLLSFQIYVVPDENRNGSTVSTPRNSIKGTKARALHLDRMSLLLGSIQGINRHVLSGNPATRGLTDIYANLEPPALSESLKRPGSSSPLSLDLARPNGMRTTLFPYQRKTLTRMIERESHNHLAADPKYLQCQASEGGVSFFLDPSTLSAVANPPMYPDIKGGLLCEEMGTGKTLVVLTLVLLTAHEVASLPDETEVAHVSCQALNARELASCFVPMSVTAQTRLSSTKALRDWELQDHAIEALSRVHQHTAAAKILEEKYSQYAFRYSRRLLDNNPFYMVPIYERVFVPREQRYEEEPKIQRRTELRILLSKATLIVVPDILVSQWQSEIKKHFDEGVLKVIVVAGPGAACPHQDRLVEADIVLMSVSAFSNEAAEGENIPWTSGKIQGDSSDQYNTSSLMRLRWKRVIVDEGHSLAGSSRQVRLAARLSTERRWIVTGTPTSNLMGEYVAEVSETLQNSGHTLTGGIHRSTPSKSSNANKGTEANDLLRIGRMMSGFLKVEPFSTDSSLWNPTISEPYILGLPGATHRLRELLSRLILRNRVQDVNSDVTLPPLSHKIVPITFDHYGRLTYNVIQSLIALNGITSQRTGKDYLFHQDNRKSLLAILANLGQATTWHSIGSEQLEIIETISMPLVEKYAHRPPAHFSNVEYMTLQEVKRHLSAAVQDPLWKEMMLQQSVFWRIANLPDIILSAWKSGRQPSKKSTSGFAYVAAEHLTLMKKHYQELEDYCDPIEGLKSAGDKQRIAEKAEETCKIKRRLSARDLSSPKKLKSTETSRASSSSPQTKSPKANKSPSKEALKSAKILENTKIKGSCSSKIEYLVAQAIEKSASGKFIIYSQYHNELYEVAQSLDLAGVKYLLLVVGLSYATRQQYLETFQNSDVFRVLIIDVKYAAQGLNITAAKHVYFCQPIWNSAVEAQAIKRAHRIGQEYPVEVETLVTLGSFEETMIRRRKVLAMTGDQLGSGIADDVGMRDMLKENHFVIDETAAGLTVSLPLFSKMKESDKAAEETALAASIAGHASIDIKQVKRPKVLKTTPTKFPRGQKEETMNRKPFLAPRQPVKTGRIKKSSGISKKARQRTG